MKGLKVIDLTSLRVKNKFLPTRSIAKATFVRGSKFLEVSISMSILLMLPRSKYNLMQS